MKNKTITEGNKLIAEFMGMIAVDEFTFKHGEEPHELIDRGRLVYHSSYDSLMFVVNKIKELKYPVMIYQSHIQNTVEIYKLGNGQSYIVRVSDTLSTTLQILWSAVVDFIEYYNHHTLKTK